MANNTFQVKRTSTSGRQPNTTNSSNSQYIAAGELALNMTDGILYTSDGSNIIAVGAKQTSNVSVNGAIIANGSSGTAGYALTSAGSGNVYWKDTTTPRVNTQTTSTSITIDASLYDQYIVTALASGITFPVATTGAVNGKKMIIRIMDNGTPQSITWGSSGTTGGFRGIGVTLPTTTTANKAMYFGCIYNSDIIATYHPNATWDVIAYALQT